MTATPSNCSTCGSWWRLPLLLALVLVAIVVVRSTGFLGTTIDRGEPARGAISGKPVGQTVALTIDFGDGRKKIFKPIAWRAGMTVRDVTRETPREDLKLEVRGEGAAAFLANLDGVANEGAGGRNWLYSVNGKPGDRSFATYELQPGDQVLWTFSGQQ